MALTKLRMIPNNIYNENNNISIYHTQRKDQDKIVFYLSYTEYDGQFHFQGIVVRQFVSGAFPCRIHAEGICG